MLAKATARRERTKKRWLGCRCEEAWYYVSGTCTLSPVRLVRRRRLARFVRPTTGSPPPPPRPGEWIEIVHGVRAHAQVAPPLLANRLALACCCTDVCIFCTLLYFVSERNPRARPTARPCVMMMLCVHSLRSLWCPRSPFLKYYSDFKYVFVVVRLLLCSY
jgi:hypothetical protein